MRSNCYTGPVSSMVDIRKYKHLWLVLLFFCMFLAACRKPNTSGKLLEEFTTEIDSDTTIGSVVEIMSLDHILVEGYGVVDGLRGTGSSDCPPNLRKYLNQYILKQLPEHRMNVEQFINSNNTAIVVIRGLMPPVASKNQYFDLVVQALPSTQTTSLKGGWLYSADLKQAGAFGATMKVLAKAGGPVFINNIGVAKPDQTTGYLLGGAVVLDEYPVNLILRQPDFKLANHIRNRLNERFGSDTAKAISNTFVELKIPSKYKNQKERFISVISAIHFIDSQELVEKRINALIRKLAVSKGKYENETALEAIGNKCLGRLTALLNSSDQQVRLSAARCMLNLGSDKGLDTLRQIANDEFSNYRVEALEAITKAGRRKDAATISRRLLKEKNLDIRLAAYRQLSDIDDVFIVRDLVARSFYLEQIAQTPHKAIYVTRSGQPRIVLFGAPIYCKDNIFIQSEDGDIMINAPAGQNYISIIKKHPTRPNVLIPLTSSFKLADLIKILGGEPTSTEQAGLNVPYGDVIAILEKMCNKGAVQAEFCAGAMPKIDRIVKK